MYIPCWTQSNISVGWSYLTNLKTWGFINILIYSSSIWWLRLSPSKYQLSTFSYIFRIPPGPIFSKKASSIVGIYRIDHPQPPMNSMGFLLAFCWSWRGATILETWNLELFFSWQKFKDKKDTEVEHGFIICCFLCEMLMISQVSAYGFKLQACWYSEMFQNLHNVKVHSDFRVVGLESLGMSWDTRISRKFAQKTQYQTKHEWTNRDHETSTINPNNPNKVALPFIFWLST